MNAPRMDTVGAHEGALYSTVELSSNPFEIGPPRALCFVIRVTYVVADRATFSANRTDPCHKR